VRVDDGIICGCFCHDLEFEFVLGLALASR
jgi:hypothetical protein